MFEKIIKFCLILVFLLIYGQPVWAADRYALVVGINDYPVRKLDGSVRDANQIANFFKSIKFTEVKTLCDKAATRQAILNGFAYFQKKVKPGDIFYFYFAGHGTVFLDSNSDDRDEITEIESGENPITKKPFFTKGLYDSAICPYDHKTKSNERKWGNLILDDELFVEFAKFAANGGFSVLIADSCHSGTLGRNPAEERKYRFLLPAEAYDEPEPENKPSTGSEMKMFKVTTPGKRAADLKGKYIALTAAADNQVSEELYFDDIKAEMGVFTYYLLQILKKNPEIAFGELVKELDNCVSTKALQKAQLEKRFFNGDLSKISLLQPQ